jgi:nucleoside-diphosphate-sugar epimerase
MPDTVIKDVAHLEDLLSEPTPYVIDTLKRSKGDFIILGVGGKMGPTLAKMIKRGLTAGGGAGSKAKVIGVSRFSGDAGKAMVQNLHASGIETIPCDLLNTDDLNKLPDCPNVVYMAAMKFGSTNQEPFTWAMNTFLPGLVAQKYKNSRIVAFSTGNIYGLSPVTHGGSVETDPPNPLGDYAMSCLGRERMFDHFSRVNKTPTALIRLNYATELRYGVLVDLCRQVWEEKPINVSMGNVNVIWQADANAMTIGAFDHASTPPFILNVSGPETLSMRKVCEEFGRLLDKKVSFTGEEAGNALLNNGQLGHRLFGYPRVSVQQLIRWTAEWVKTGGASLGKPTHFEARDGKF